LYILDVLESSNRNLAALLLTVVVAMTGASCRTARGGAGLPIVQPGAPGQPSRVVSAATAADQTKVQYTPADVRFMQGMIHHHAQALDMTALLASRTGSEDMRKLAQRIEVSQADEINMMRKWLEARGQDVPGPHAHHAPDAPLMPGMLTEAEMGQLAAAKGVEFDRLFLQYMIKHHAGALVMVTELVATAGAAQEGEIFGFASDVDADQRIEMNRMGTMLRELGK
jgi:uncharacterized protein (DUF305 family)